jgi:iron(III) transport system permease protein
MSIAAAPVSGAASARLRRGWVGRPGWALLSVVTAALVVLPVAMLVTTVLRPDAEMWRQQWNTRLPEQIVSTLVLLAGVVSLSTVLGVSLAWLVTAHTFPGRRTLGWMLVLPLAMPSYILGFVTTAVFDVAGPIQTWWRDQFGRDAWFPDVRSMPFAIVTLALTLYPYVYLLARAALRDQAASAQLVARTLGASRGEATRRVVLPMLRPAVAAGAAVVAMETLTDFATVQYFDVETVTVGMFRIWRGSYDRDAASEIAALVLLFALLAIAVERLLRGRARFGESGGENAGIEPSRLTGMRGVGAAAACGAVVTVAFAAPVLRLVTWAIAEQRGPRGTPMMDEYPGFLRNSLVLAGTTTLICVLVAAVVTNAGRFGEPRLVGPANRLSAVGYAVPGPVVGMGVVLLLVAFDDRLEAVGFGLPGVVATGSFVVLAYAYAIRFLAPALGAAESGLGQVPGDMTAVARSLGAPPTRILRRIHLPLSRTSLLTAALLVGVDALKELPLAYLLRPVGFDTLPVWVYNLASESRFEQAALPALSIIVVATIPVVLLCRQFDRPAR